MRGNCEHRGVLRRVLKGLAALTLILALAVPGSAMLPPQTAYAATLNELQQKQDNLAKQQKANAAKMNKLKADKANQQTYLNTLQDQIATVQAMINNSTDQINQKNAQITALTAQIAEQQVDIDGRIVQLKDRLRALYMTGEASNLEIILNAQNVMDLSDKMEIIDIITRHDTGLITYVQGQMDAVKNTKAQIEQARNEVAAQKAEQDKQKANFNTLEIEAERVMKEINKNVNAASDEAKRIAKEKKAADAAVDKWIADYNAAHQGQNNSGGYTSTGNFTWPCPGYTKLTTRFKEVIYGQAHRGIDVGSTGGRAINGAPIVAADSGKVIKAGWNSSYGNCVYIDHGGGYITRYGHASRLACKEGDIVKKGKTIAYVGSTGNSSGPHLHFEVILNGGLKNPMNYFK